ncbi:MAG TPA: class I SAM-dependent methyltransferase [Polyangiaceae bacterium]|nr:class I SAM-dependent methyltransferase [Polyangiaceae bacterium]
MAEPQVTTGDAEHVRAALAHNEAFYRTYYRNPLIHFRYDLLYRARRIAKLLASSGVDVSRPGFSVFEYGFGAGHLLKTLRHASLIKGVEASDAAVARLREKWPSNAARLELEQWSDATRLPYGDAEFDLTICSHVLEHLPDDELALAELERLTRPGGHLLIILPANERLFPGSKHLRLYAVEEFSERLRRRGLEQVAVDEHQRFDRPWKHYKLILATRTSRLARVGLSGTAALAFLPPALLSWQLLAALDGVLARTGAPSTSIAYLFRKPLR